MLRVALVHDWLTGMRGGEKCLDRLCHLFPTAPVHTLFHAPGKLNSTIESHTIRTSYLQWVPGWRRHYRYLLPMFPSAARWNIEPCDVVVSLSHCVAKAAKPPAGIPHICYCFTPMRYAWHMRDQYLSTSRKTVNSAQNWLFTRLRNWDRQTSDRVTHFVAISKTIQRRIRECYDRDSVVIYPPVDTDFYHPRAMPRENYYLIVSAFAPYKRLELAIEACNCLGRELVVIGTGQCAKQIKASAGPTVHFLGWQTNEVIRSHFRRCQALLFPGEEDFGIVPLEAQACGAPVIAFGRGGATETVIPQTGVFFHEQSRDALIDAIERFEGVRNDLSPLAARDWAKLFSVPRFDQQISDYIYSIVDSAKVVRRAA